MMHYTPEKVFKGIILHKVEYRESSLICQVITSEFGMISLLAKGVRKPASNSYGLLQIQSELEFSAHHKKDANWYILKSAELIDTYSSKEFETSIILQAACELFCQLLTASSDADEYYTLLRNFLIYTHKIDKNAITLFWRLMFSIFKLCGITPELKICAHCHGSMSRPAAYQIAKSAFICSQCSGKIAPQAMMELTDKQQELLNLIPVIGNHLAVLEIDKATAQELTNLLLNHLNFHYSNHFNLKSLKVLFQKI